MLWKKKYSYHTDKLAREWMVDHVADIIVDGCHCIHFYDKPLPGIEGHGSVYMVNGEEVNIIAAQIIAECEKMIKTGEQRPPSPTPN